MKTKTESDSSDSIEEKMKTLQVLLTDMADLDPKLKLLWAEIYQNAVTDRRFASIMYEDLLQKILAMVENHGLYGDKIAKYMERMSKANDQLLLLAKYISEHVSESSQVDMKDLYDKISTT